MTSSLEIFLGKEACFNMIQDDKEQEVRKFYVTIIATYSSSRVQIDKVELYLVEPEENNQTNLFCRNCKGISHCAKRSEFDMDVLGNEPLVQLPIPSRHKPCHPLGVFSACNGGSRCVRHLSKPVPGAGWVSRVP